jgi:hypothetical protein
LQAVQVGVVLHPADLNSLGRRNGTDRVPLSQQTRSSQSIWGRNNTATIQKKKIRTGRKCGEVEVADMKQRLTYHRQRLS